MPNCIWTYVFVLELFPTEDCLPLKLFVLIYGCVIDSYCELLQCYYYGFGKLQKQQLIVPCDIRNSEIKKTTAWSVSH